MQPGLIQFLIVCPLVGLAGFIDAVAGGGGLIALPAYMFAGLSVHEAIGTSKLSATMGSTLATIRYARAGYIPLKITLFCVAAALAGSSIGANISLRTSDFYLKIIILILLPFLAWRLTKKNAIEKVYEWLPADTARKNLHKLMFALGFALTKDAAGEIVFRYLSDAISGTIPGARTFYGGTIEHQRPVSAVEVTEHSFVQTVLDEEATLFDNAGDAAVSNLTVTFDSPVHDLTAGSGLTIVSSGVNFAVISGVGTLTGKKYTHNA
ncbi:MAG: TSUP family transporter, partial [Firmicutes bacterium]|nr:TSUP family transporter [Bacillota bacterium]